ncbi:MAG: polysaccharide biosynthesis tyrosine autokinase [Gemmatimonadaceae bacterium]
MRDLVPYSGRGNVNGPEPELKGGFDAPEAASTESVGIREYVGMVRRHIWVFLGIVAIVVAYTVNSVLKEPPRYRAVSTVRLVDSRRAMTGGMDGGGMDMQVSRQSDILESQIQILQSRAVGAAAVDLKGLRLVPVTGSMFPDEISEAKVADTVSVDSLALVYGALMVTARTPRSQVTASYGAPAELDGISITVAKPPPVSASTFEIISRENAIGRVIGSLEPYARPKTDILDLAYTGSDPYEVRRIANAVAEASQAHDAAGAQQDARRRRGFLEGQLRETDAMLERASRAYSGFRSGRQVFSSTLKAGAQEAGLVDIDMRRAELDAEKSTYERLLAQGRTSGEKVGSSLRVLVSSPGIASNPVVTQLYGQLTDYEKKRDDLISAGAAQSNPDVVTLNELIPETSTQILDAVRSQIQSLGSRIEALDRLRSSGASQIAAAPAAETEELQLLQQVQTVQKRVDQLQEELQKAKMTEAVEAGQIEIVDLVEKPGNEIPNGSSRRLALGVLIGTILGIAATMVLESMNDSIRRRSDIEKILKVPGLAVIPRLATSANGSRNFVQRALPSRSSKGRGAPTGGLEELVTITDVRSSAAESYRTLRTNLMFSQAVRALRTLVVTSASPGEGKTTTAANLAVSFAQQGMRVLLVDCDLRRARLHKLFDMSREPGLTDLVIGLSDADAVCRQTSVTGLYLLPAGPLPPNPAELLGSEGMRRTLETLAEAYDLIVVDTPPLLAASDAAILATIADGVIIVLRAGATETSAAEQSMQQLNAVGARVVGAVLNDPDAQVPRYGAYYRYDYAGSEG